jgi:hypothetical protein
MNKKIILLIVVFTALIVGSLNVSAQEVIVLNLNQGDLNGVLSGMLTSNEKIIFESEMVSMDTQFKDEFVKQMTKSNALSSSKLQTQVKDYMDFINSDKQIHIDNVKLTKIQNENFSLRQITNFILS